MIKGNQCTILWHVDDLNADVVTDKVIGLLESEFRKEAASTKSRGKVHAYLGMVIDCSIPGKVMITMIDYIKNMLNDLPSDMDGTAPNPTASYLFEIDDESATNLSRTSVSCIITTRKNSCFNANAPGQMCKRP